MFSSKQQISIVESNAAPQSTIQKQKIFSNGSISIWVLK